MDRYKKEEKGLPPGGLSAYEKKGKRYYISVVGKDKIKKCEYLGNSSNIRVQQLQKKYFLNKSIQAIESNIKWMEKFIVHYKNTDPNFMQANFPKAYQSLPENCYDLAGTFNLRQWASKEYRKSKEYPEHLRHKTKQGFLVRSKSEVIIANSVADRGLFCRYEEVLYLKDGTRLFPDFVIANPKENRLVYWEHFGMLFDEEYQEKMVWKIKKYIENGIVPGVNLIITFDDQDGNIDSMMIERTLDLWFGTD